MNVRYCARPVLGQYVPESKCTYNGGLVQRIYVPINDPSGRTPRRYVVVVDVSVDDARLIVEHDVWSSRVERQDIFQGLKNIRHALRFVETDGSCDDATI